MGICYSSNWGKTQFTQSKIEIFDLQNQKTTTLPLEESYAFL